MRQTVILACADGGEVQFV